MWSKTPETHHLRPKSRAPAAMVLSRDAFDVWRTKMFKRFFRVAYDGPIIWFGYMCMTFVSQLKCKTDQKKLRLYNDSQGKWQLQKKLLHEVVAKITKYAGLQDHDMILDRFLA